MTRESKSKAFKVSIWMLIRWMEWLILVRTCTVIRYSTLEHYHRFLRILKCYRLGKAISNLHKWPKGHELISNKKTLRFSRSPNSWNTINFPETTKEAFYVLVPPTTISPFFANGEAHFIQGLDSKLTVTTGKKLRENFRCIFETKLLLLVRIAALTYFFNT